MRIVLRLLMLLFALSTACSPTGGGSATGSGAPPPERSGRPLADAGVGNAKKGRAGTEGKDPGSIPSKDRKTRPDRKEIPTLTRQEGREADRHCLDSTAEQVDGRQKKLDACMLHYRKPFADLPFVERLTGSAAKASWKHSPILISDSGPRGESPPANQTFFAVWKQDFRDQGLAVRELAVAYDDPPNGVRARNYQGTIDAGAIWIFARFVPITKWQHDFNDEGTVVARGVTMRVYEQTLDEDGRAHRSIRWDTEATGGRIRWEVTNSPLLHSREATVSFIEALREVA